MTSGARKAFGPYDDDDTDGNSSGSEEPHAAPFPAAAPAAEGAGVLVLMRALQLMIAKGSHPEGADKATRAKQPPHARQDGAEENATPFRGGARASSSCATAAATPPGGDTFLNAEIRKAVVQERAMCKLRSKVSMLTARCAHLEDKITLQDRTIEVLRAKQA